MDIVLIIIQILLLIVAGAALWQIWKFLNRKDIPGDEVLGEERAKYLTDRLNVLQVCMGVEVVLCILHFILQAIEVFQRA